MMLLYFKWFAFFDIIPILHCCNANKITTQQNKVNDSRPFKNMG